MSKEPSSEPRKWKVDEDVKQLIAPTGERFSVGFASMDSYPLAKLINAALAAEREGIKPLVEALEFYARREHWMSLTDKPYSPQTNLIAHGKHMTTGNGYDEADAALASVKVQP